MRHGLAIAGILDLQGRRFSELFPHPQPVVRYAPSHRARGAQAAFDSAPRLARNGGQRSGSPIVQLNLWTISRMGNPEWRQTGESFCRQFATVSGR